MRDRRLDFIRGICIVSIVFSHALQRGMVDYTGEKVSTILFLITMPTFFFLSGFNMARRKSLRPLGFLYDILKRGIGYFWPYIFFLLLRTYIYGQFVDFPKAFSDSLDNPGVGLWFLWLLTWMNVVLDVGLLLSSITKKHPKVYGAIFLTAGFVTVIILRFNNVIFSDTFLGYDLFLLFIPITLVGYLLGGQFFRFAKGVFRYHYVLLGVAGTIIFCIVCPAYYGTTLEDRQLIIYAGSLFPILSFVGFGSLLADKRWTDVVLCCGRFSLEIYFLHLMILKAWPNLIVENDFLTWVYIFMAAYIALVFSYAVIKVTHEYPFMHLLAFGRSFGDNPKERKWLDQLRAFCLAH